MNKKIVEIEQICFFISYFIFLMYSFFGHIDMFGYIMKNLTNISMGFIIFVFILNLKKYSYDDILRMLILLLVAVLVVVISKDFMLIKMALILIITKNINFDTKIKYDLILRIVFIGTMCYLYESGIAPDVVGYRDGTLIHSMGFTNPNVFGMHTLITCIEITYLNRKNLNILKIILISTIMIWCNTICGTRSALYLYILTIVLFIILKKNKNFYNNRIVKSIIIYSPIITSILILVFYILFINNTNLGIVIDNALSSRIMLIQDFSSKIPITLLGTNISLYIDRTCDIAIVYILFSFGVVGCIAYIVVFCLLFKILYNNDKIEIAIVMFIFIMYGMSERLWLYADYNLIVTAFSYLLYNKKKIGVKI